jgi:hypothetical protein
MIARIAVDRKDPMHVIRGRSVLLASTAAVLAAGTDRGGGVIEVHARRCPASHPHKVGSFSYSSTRIADGRVEHRSSSVSLCAR